MNKIQKLKINILKETSKDLEKNEGPRCSAPVPKRPSYEPLIRVSRQHINLNLWGMALTMH